MTINLNAINPNATSVGSNLCTRGHIVIWAGDPYYEIPDGTPCACGMTTVRRVTCPTCGHTEMKMVEKEDRPRKRHPGDFDYWPSDEQMSYFVRGGR